MKIKKKIVKLLKIVILFTGFIFIVLFIFKLVKGDFFKVNQVLCFDDGSPCQTDIWFKINSFALGKNLISLSPQDISQQIKNEFSEIEEVEIKKELPNRLIINLTKRKAIAVIEMKNEYWQVDYRGIILTRRHELSDLPLIVSDEVAISSDGEKIESPQVLASLDCLYKLLFKNLEPYRMEIQNPQTLIIYLRTGSVVLYSFKNDWQLQVDSLQLILERAKIEGKQIKVIDLRFDKPVITYQK